MESITRLALLTAIINRASIDGQTGASGRHPVAGINTLINLYCREARGIAADAGAPWFQVLDAITPLPAAVANEDFIEIPMPTTAIEILGVDVQTQSAGSNFPLWDVLNSADWSQRRLLTCTQPPSGAGWWAIEKMPEARDASTITPGAIALFPDTLKGNYRVTYRDAFTDMTQDTSLFVGIAPMFTWVIFNCVAVIVGPRDTNKRETYASALQAIAKAEERIKVAAKRTQMGGVTFPRPLKGTRLR